jgi:hypothetical protein
MRKVPKIDGGNDKMKRGKAITSALIWIIIFSTVSVFSVTVNAPTTYEYLVVTTVPLSDEFQVLADWKAKWVDGAKVETVTANATDVQIKSVIEGYYINHGTKYVLLGGDVGAIPCHTVQPLENSSATIAEDWWFANLDGDEEISEYEVYIGRAPVDNDTEAANFARKVISYEQMDKPKANLFHQSRIKPNNDPDSRELAWQCESFAPLTYTDYELFEENGKIEKADWIDFWNNDAIMFEHIGHGFGEVDETLGDPNPGTYTINYEVGGEVKWNVTDVHSLNNTFWPVHTSVACTIGNFTHEDCLAEAYVKEPDHGAIAVFANSHLGWFSRGDATRFSGDFIEMQFKVLYEEGYENIGSILARSKHYFIDEATNSSSPFHWVWDWCWREINLIGDPETPVLTQRHSPPATPSSPSGPTTGYAYSNIEFHSSTTDPEGDDVLYEFSWGDNTTTITGPCPSGENATASHQWKWPVQYEVEVRAKDVYGAWSDWSNATSISLSQDDAGTGQDAGDDYASATPVTPNSYKGTLYYPMPPDTNDYYRFSVQIGQTIAVSMTPPEGANFDLELYSPSDPNNPEAGSYNENDTTDSVTIYQAESGNWTAKIFQDSGEGQCSFIISVYTPGGGCPFVYAWNGTDYVIDNNLLPWSASSNGTEVEDYYRLEQAMASILGRYYSLLIGEFQQEHSYFDKVQLFTVDHDADVSVAVSPTGEVLTHQDPNAPVSAVDEQGVSWLERLSRMDGDYYEGCNGSFVVLDFGEVAAEDAKLVMRADRPPEKYSIHVQVLDSAEDWVDVVSIIPRTYWATEIVDLSSHIPASGDLKVRLYFTDKHKVDFVGLDMTPQAQVTVEEAQLRVAYHSDYGIVTNKLLSDDDISAELVPGQQLVLFFVSTERNGEQRTFILHVKGYYTIRN